MLFAQVPTESVDQITKIASGTGYTATGVLLIVLAAIGYAIWKVALWAGVRVDKLLERAFSHLDDVKSVMGSLEASISKIPTRLDSIEGKVDGLTTRVDKLDDHLFKDSK